MGFGGTVNGRTSHCFPLNGNSRDPYCYGIEGIIDAYYSSLEHGKSLRNSPTKQIELQFDTLHCESDIFYIQFTNWMLVPLSDPTWFAPVINYVKSIAEHMKSDQNNYLVLLIITDGGIEGTIYFTFLNFHKQ